MVRILLLCAMLFQASPQTALKPSIDNDRITVWGIGDSPAARTFDAVEVSMSGAVEFLPFGKPPHHNPRFSIMIDLKDHPVAPIANTSGYPLAFPRPEAKKVLENERVIVWDYTWTPSVAHPHALPRQGRRRGLPRRWRPEFDHTRRKSYHEFLHVGHSQI